MLREKLKVFPKTTQEEKHLELLEVDNLFYLLKLKVLLLQLFLSAKSKDIENL